MEIIEIPYLLSQEKCSYVIELAKKHGILNSKNDTSLNANFIIEYDEHDDDVLDSIENSISSQIGISVKNFECLQVVRYNVDGNITTNIITTNTVNTTSAGTYTVTYNVSDAAGNAATPVVRTVNVLDTEAPVITIIGGSTVTVNQGATYTDSGATATESV